MWLVIVHSGDWCVCVVLWQRTPSGACHKRRSSECGWEGSSNVYAYLSWHKLLLQACKSNVITVICDTAAFPKVHIWCTYIPEHSRAYNRRSSKVEVDVSICVNIVASVFRLYLAALLTDEDSKTTQQSLRLIRILKQFAMQFSRIQLNRVWRPTRYIAGHFK